MHFSCARECECICVCHCNSITNSISMETKFNYRIFSKYKHASPFGTTSRHHTPSEPTSSGNSSSSSNSEKNVRQRTMLAFFNPNKGSERSGESTAIEPRICVAGKFNKTYEQTNKFICITKSIKSRIPKETFFDDGRSDDGVWFKTKIKSSQAKSGRSKPTKKYRE